MTGNWRDRAACRGHNVNAWFPHPGGRAATAMAVCATCSVAADCLADALAAPSLDDKGIRGGLHEVERRRLRRTRQVDA